MIVYSTTAMAERRDSSDSRSESGDSDTTRTILSSSSYEYIDPEGGANIEPYYFEAENEADGQDSASTVDDDATTITKTIFSLETLTGKLQYFLYNNVL